jgi:hypothetical protein
MLDEVFKADYEIHGDQLVRRLTQPTENIILNRNAELRKNPGAIRDMSFGRMVASIPFNDYEFLRRKYPELVYGDAEQRQKCMYKILSSSEGARFLVRDHL